MIASDCFQLVIKNFEKLSIDSRNILFSVVKSGVNETGDRKKGWRHVHSVIGAVAFCCSTGLADLNVFRSEDRPT